LPLIGTFIFSLRAKRDTLSFLAYGNVFYDPKFWETFGFSALMALCTVIVSLLLIVPTAYWVHLRLPRLRPLVELITLLPFVIPTIVLVFGLIRIYSRPPFVLTGSAMTTNILLVAGYTVLSLPYMYRAVDTGLRAIDVRTLTEAAQSLGAGWPTILWRVIFPNLRAALLSGAFLTFAIVIGEFVLASFLARPAFGPYMALLGRSKAYEPAALAIISFLLTWVAVGLIQIIGRGQERSQLTGTR
jgi:putative spermidine/putrescine transport system permease protein